MDDIIGEFTSLERRESTLPTQSEYSDESPACIPLPDGGIPGAPEQDEQGAILPDNPEPLRDANGKRQIEGYKVMTIALIQTAMGLKAPSGGFRGNYATLYALKQAGHEVMQFVWAHAHEVTESIAESKAAGTWSEEAYTTGFIDTPDPRGGMKDLKFWVFYNAHGILNIAVDADVIKDSYSAYMQQLDAQAWVENHAQPARTVPYAKWIVENLVHRRATHVIFNDAFPRMATDHMTDIARVEVFHTFEQIPAGPFLGGMKGGSKTMLELPYVRCLDLCVTVSDALQEYAYTKGGIGNAVMLPNHLSTYLDKDTGAFPEVRKNFDLKNIYMINPSGIKGFSIFYEMAKENLRRQRLNAKDGKDRPVYNFVALRSWGTKEVYATALKEVGVTVHKYVPNMEPVYDDMSVLIVPSLWQEAWGLVATEAQLRGIPVIAANVGGLPEAKRFTSTIITVNEITGIDRDAIGEYVIPEQDAQLWTTALDKLMSRQKRYEDVAQVQYDVTKKWLDDFDVRGMEKQLLKIMK